MGASTHINAAASLLPEVYNILQVLKKNSGGVRFFSDDTNIASLISSFTELRQKLRNTISQETTLTIDDCFRAFIQLFSTVTNSTVLSTGLSVVAKLLRQDFFDFFAEKESFFAFRSLLLSVCKCKFEIGEISGDEYSLQRLLDVIMLGLKTEKYSKDLSDADICLIIESCFSMSALTRPSDFFRRHVDLICIELSTILFGRLNERGLPQTASNIPLKILIPATRIDGDEPLPPALAAFEAELQKAEEENKETASQTQSSPAILKVNLIAPERPVSAPEFASAASAVDQTEHFYISRDAPSPYGVSAIQEFASFLARLLDPSEKKSTDRLKSVSMVILSDFIERHHCTIGSSPFFFNFVSTQIVKHAVQLLLIENPALQVHLSQLLTSLFVRFGNCLIPQGEHLLTSILGILSIKASQPGAKVPPPRISKEYYLELLSTIFLNQPSLVRISAIYENGIRFSFALTDLINNLCQLTIPLEIAKSPQEAALAVECLLQILKCLNHSPDAVRTRESSDIIGHLENASKFKKIHLRKSAEIFNTQSPNGAFAYIATHGLTSSPATSQEIAQYLRRTPGLDKKVVGEIISKPSNVDILKEFLTDFHFAGLRIDEALRLVLESFRLPGEAQQISRIMEAFASAYFETSNGVFASSDAVFVLAYSIVMLNTDQHNRQVKHRMAEADFIKNNRGVNDGKDFDAAFLKRIYHAIKQKEIILPEEHSGEISFNFIWNEQLKKYPDSKPVDLGMDITIGKDIASVLWRPVLSCFKSLITTPKSESMSKNAVIGLSILGEIGSLYLDNDAFGELLATESECLAISQIASREQGAETIIKFLTKSEMFQMLSTVFFGAFYKNGSKVDEAGWKLFVSHLLHFAEMSLIDTRQFLVESELNGNSPSHQDSSHSTSPRPSSGGILSTIQSYWAGSTPSEQISTDPIPKEQAVNFLKGSCHIEDILRESNVLENDSLCDLIKAIVDNVRPSKPSTWTTETHVFAVDVTVTVAWLNRDRMSVFWDFIFKYFSELARDPSIPPSIKEHVILGLGKLSLRVADRPDMQKEVVQFFQMLCYLPPESFQHLAEPALAIVIRIVELDPPILHGSAIWPHYFTVLALAGRSRSCGPYSFSLLSTIVREDSILFPLEFFSEYIDLLNGFIASASTAHSSSRVTITEDEENPLELAKKALITFIHLESNIRRIEASDKSSIQQLWHDFIIPIHSAIAQQCYHPAREVRQQALSQLQKSLLSIDYTELPIEALLEDFQLVLLPLLEELKRPEIMSLDGVGNGMIEEIQARSSALVAKVLLKNTSILFPPGQLVEESSLSLWCSLLSHLLRFLEGPSVGDILKESIPETLKNLLLVMSASGIMDPRIPESSQSSLWVMSWRLIGPVLPKLKQETFNLDHGEVPSALPETQEIEKGPDSCHTDVPPVTLHVPDDEDGAYVANTVIIAEKIEKDYLSERPAQRDTVETDIIQPHISSVNNSFFDFGEGPDFSQLLNQEVVQVENPNADTDRNVKKGEEVPIALTELESSPSPVSPTSLRRPSTSHTTYEV